MGETGHRRASADHLTSGPVLARSTAFNALGQALPLIAALVCIPFLVHGLGTDRYGVLALAGVLIGYFGLFDLGLGRALTQLVAERLGRGERDDLPVAVWTALALMFALGLLGGGVLGLIAPWLVVQALKIPEGLQPETLGAVYLIAAGVPAVTTSAGLRGVLEAHQRFGLLNLVRIPLGVFGFLGPLLVMQLSTDLVPVMAVVVAGLYAGAAAFAVLCFGVMPGLRHGLAIAPSLLGSLLRFGAWMTVSNVVSPLMVSLDRFLIGATLSVTAVTFYSTSYDAVTRLWIIPGALAPVLFPAFASVSSRTEGQAGALLSRGVRYVYLTLFPVTLVVVALAREGLALWLGEEFAERSALVLQVLAVGVLVNSLAHIPFALVQGFGRASWTAKLHAAELPFYLAAVWWLIDGYGIDGAAVAWTLRVIADAAVLFAMTHRLVGKQTTDYLPTAGLMIVSLAALAVAAALPTAETRVVYSIAGLALFAALAWRVLLTAEERAFLVRLACAAKVAPRAGRRPL